MQHTAFYRENGMLGLTKVDLIWSDEMVDA